MSGKVFSRADTKNSLAQHPCDEQIYTLHQTELLPDTIDQDSDLRGSDLEVTSEDLVQVFTQIPVLVLDEFVWGLFEDDHECDEPVGNVNIAVDRQRMQKYGEWSCSEWHTSDKEE